MLTITIPSSSFYDEEKNEFIDVKEQTLQLEHSLISISKWESKWKTSFLSTNDKTVEQIVDYIKCMTVNQNVDPNVYLAIDNDVVRQVNEYINDSMTATFFSDRGQKSGKREVITSELIYYWMIAQNIPMECQKWHLNRLLTLIKVCSIKNSPPKKQNKSEMLAERARLNAQRKAAMNSHG